VNPYDYVFEVSADYVNISGFTVTGATGDYSAGILMVPGVGGICIRANHCNITNNKASNHKACGISLWDTNNSKVMNNNASNNYSQGHK
jgi:parallel beta-helix repeat protein